MYLVSHYLYYKHPDSAAHKKDDDFIIEQEQLILSNTTSESNLSGISEPAPTISLEEFVDEDMGLEGISPPDGWVLNDLHRPGSSLSESAIDHIHSRRVRFHTPLRRDSSNANLSHHSDISLSSNREEHPNYLLRIGSTHVSLSSLGDEENSEQNSGIFSKTGFYW